MISDEADDTRAAGGGMRGDPMPACPTAIVSGAPACVRVTDKNKDVYFLVLGQLEQRCCVLKSFFLKRARRFKVLTRAPVASVLGMTYEAVAWQSYLSQALGW